MLVVVGGRKTTDEEMLKSVRELIFEEKVSYIDHVIKEEYLERNTKIVWKISSCFVFLMFIN